MGAPKTSPELTPTRQGWREFATLGLPACLVLLCVWLAFGGVHWNARLPLGFSGDALFYLVQSKSTLDHGWWWTNPSIGAPLGYHALTFAQNTNVDQAIIRTIGLFTRETGLAVNVAWLAMLGLSAVTATWGLRRLGVSRLGAGAAGVLFALSPFALSRNIGHFNLVTYLLPFPATTALLLASSGRDRPWRARDLAVPVAGCALVGFNYIYFAFFGAFIVAVGACIGAARIRSVTPLKAGALCLGALILTTTLNLIPNELAWQAYGQPVGVRHAAAESEVYGLKVRHLVSPTRDHWFGPFKTWLDRDKAAEFPNENENTLARLGAVATAGFLGLIAALIFPAAPRRDDEHRIQAAAALAVALVLLATVGGFGTLFNLLIAPEIRAYNRVSPFVAFFALAGVVMWIDRVTRASPSRLRAGLFLVLLAVGLADQWPALRKVAVDLPSSQKRFEEVAAFTSGLEEQLPADAMVYQLPARPYPVDPGMEGGMGVYDHFRPYLTTHRLRWSYPALTRNQIAWERAVAGVEEADLPRYLAREGFSAILINRAGYRDHGRSIERALEDASTGATVLAANNAFVALDLRHLRPAPVPR